MSEPPEKLMEMVRDEVKTAFAEVGGDYFRPTLDSLTQVVNVLGRKAASRGTPSEVIEYHKGEVRKVLHMLAIRSGSRQHTLQA